MDERYLTTLESIASSLARIAEHLAPLEVPRERLPAILSKATYSREERERQELRQRLKGSTPKSPGRSSAPSRSDL